MITGTHSVAPCGIILAAGDGKRLRPFVQRLRGDHLPKQYVNFIGTRSMLEHTFHRVNKLVPPSRLFTVISQDHMGHPEVRQQLATRPKGTIVVQPENKETGPGILLPLMHLYKRFGDSTVAVFPSDHFILEEDHFMSQVSSAGQAVERDPSRVILLGVEPDGPEPDYGYVVAGGRAKSFCPFDVREVVRFVEKPEPHVAAALTAAGGLWNTMIMVFKVRTFLDLARRILPGLYCLSKASPEQSGPEMRSLC